MISYWLLRSQPKRKNHKHRDDDGNEDHNVPEFVKDLSNEFVNDDETGPDVSLDLARLFQNMLRKAALEGKIRDKMARYPRPDNVPLLQAPKVNPEIWSKLKANTSMDIKMQKCQTKIVKGLVPIAKLLDNLFEQRKPTGQSTQLDHNISSWIWILFRLPVRLAGSCHYGDENRSDRILTFSTDNCVHHKLKLQKYYLGTTFLKQSKISMKPTGLVSV